MLLDLVSKDGTEDSPKLRFKVISWFKFRSTKAHHDKNMRKAMPLNAKFEKQGNRFMLK
jgi:hypothetical protein